MERYHVIGGHLRLDQEGTVTSYADAQATIAALQSEVKDLKEWLAAYKQSLELAQSSLAQRTAERDTARRRVDELEAREVDVVLLRDDLEQRTAELEAARGERDRALELRGRWQAQLGKEQADSFMRNIELVKLRALILALPKVEGAVVVSNGYVKDSTRCHALFGADEDAASYAALLRARRGKDESR